MESRLLAASAVAVSLLAGAGWAGTATNSMTVQATVVDECVIDSVGTMDFGSTIGGTIDANIDSSADIKVTCNTGATYDVGLGTGNGTGATVTTRAMTGTSDTLPYGLYSDASRSTNWGETVSTDTVSGIGDSTSQTHTVYGRIPASAGDTATGSYSDTVAVTVTF